MTGRERVLGVLDRTASIVNERGATHGDPLKQHRRLAKLWSAYLDQTVEAHDAAVMLALLKISRIAESVAPPQDSFDDTIGYAAIAAACSEALSAETTPNNDQNRKCSD